MTAKIISPVQQYLTELHARFAANKDGQVADYIPELKKANPDWFGITFVTVDGHVYQEGDTREPFSIQSMSKPFTYGMALEAHGVEFVQSKVGMEPSGEAFNSISLDSVTGRPMNPMINAGAIASAGMIYGQDLDERLGKILGAYEKYVGHNLEVDRAVYLSESETGHRNRAIGHMLRSFDVLDDDPHETLELYFQQCAISVTCRDLAMMAATLANNGVNPITGVRALESQYVEKVLSVMASCGMYDYAGSWIYEVGLPAKSGVAGGVLAVLPGQLGVAIFSPPLDDKGNSVRGIEVCKQVSKDFDLHMLNTNRSTISVIRARYDASRVVSKRSRPILARQALREHGEKIKIWELHGDLVFGSAEFVLDDVVSGIDATQFVILDLKRVFNIDLAAARLIKGLCLQLNSSGRKLLITNYEGNFQFSRYLRHELESSVIDIMLAHADRDSALEFCETELLDTLNLPDHEDKFFDLKEQSLCVELSEQELLELGKIVVHIVYQPGEHIIEESAEADCLYFLAKGYVSVNLKAGLNKYRRLATLTAGMPFGESAMIDRKPRSATIIAENNVECFRLDTRQLAVESAVRQNIKAKLLAALAIDLTQKLRIANEEIRSIG